MRMKTCVAMFAALLLALSLGCASTPEEREAQRERAREVARDLCAGNDLALVTGLITDEKALEKMRGIQVGCQASGLSPPPEAGILHPVPVAVEVAERHVRLAPEPSPPWSVHARPSHPPNMTEASPRDRSTEIVALSRLSAVRG